MEVHTSCTCTKCHRGGVPALGGASHNPVLVRVLRAAQHNVLARAPTGAVQWRRWGVGGLGVGYGVAKSIEIVVVSSSPM